MVHHFDFQGKLATRMENAQFSPSSSPSDKLLILQILLKLADISYYAR